MKPVAWPLLVACAMALSTPCVAAKKKQTRLYRNDKSGFCVEVPANWNGPAVVMDRAGARFDVPTGGASITFALSPNQPRSIVLKEKNAGSQAATLDDYREAIPNTWRSDNTVSDVKVVRAETTTLNNTSALHIELSYKRARATWRYEIVFALLENEQYALEYDAEKHSAKHYEKDFQAAVNSFTFHCPADTH